MNRKFGITFGLGVVCLCSPNVKEFRYIESTQFVKIFLVIYTPLICKYFIMNKIVQETASVVFGTSYPNKSSYNIV